MTTTLPVKRFRSELAALATRLRQHSEDEAIGLSRVPADRQRRLQRAKREFRFFAKTYFPHYISPHDSQLHTYLYKRLPKLLHSQRRGVKLAIAAPRGEAKSTLVTQIFTLWCAITGSRRYIPIIMDSQHQAAAMLEAIKAELLGNRRLALDFPEACGCGPVWKAGVMVTTSGTKIQAFGSGRRMRGLRHGNFRPDMVICDDLENDVNVRSRQQRDQLEEWLRSTVLKLGAADDSMDLLLVGTVLHSDSLLARLLRNPLWESKRFQAIIEWPRNMALWEHWQNCLLQEGEQAADHFFQQHRQQMEEGALLSWPKVRSLEALMKIRLRDGSAAFAAELQNQPLSEQAIFQKIHYWSEQNPAWLFFGAVDPSLGKSGGKGDPSAILVGGFDRATGILDLVEADICTRLPDRIISDVMEYQARYNCRLWVVEAIQFQEFFKDELIRRSAQQGVPVPAQGSKPSRDKGLRISSLQPHVANGLIRFHSKQITLLEQLRRWGEGTGEHDDGPDALEMLWRSVQENLPTMGEVRSLGKRLSQNMATPAAADQQRGSQWGGADGRLDLGGF
ncbi:phage terminase large subunit [Candidatus Magnetaquicoccus inordinatus]|uniref:phage terminase large subunit n=1 Tax=Candidatus Magnetaquicoccus inordinatus TaxID=2496818 RepID=UPI00102CCDB7|nr:phage terminase large subunit [Candidatus Magnetaquicoccus inordinatus]